MSDNTKDKKQENDNQDNYFGGISEYKLADIETEVLNDNVYLDVFAGSDVQFKEDVSNFQNALDVISNLNVYKYNYKVDEFKSHNFPQEKQVGIMAQDLEEVMPHLVKKDSEGYRHVNYAGLTPVLLSAVKELHQKNLDQSAELAKITNLLTDIQAELKKLK